MSAKILIKLTAEEVAKIRRLFKADVRLWAEPRVRTIKVVERSRHALVFDADVHGRRRIGIRWLTGVLNGHPDRRNLHLTRRAALQRIVEFHRSNVRYCRKNCAAASKLLKRARHLLSASRGNR